MCAFFDSSFLSYIVLHYFFSFPAFFCGYGTFIISLFLFQRNLQSFCSLSYSIIFSFSFDIFFCIRSISSACSLGGSCLFLISITMMVDKTDRPDKTPIGPLVLPPFSARKGGRVLKTRTLPIYGILDWASRQSFHTRPRPVNIVVQDHCSQ